MESMECFMFFKTKSHDLVFSCYIWGLVQLYENGKSRVSIAEEYDLTASALDRWIMQAYTTGSFSEKDNRSPKKMSFSHCENDCKWWSTFKSKQR